MNGNKRVSHSCQNKLQQRPGRGDAERKSPGFGVGPLYTAYRAKWEYAMFGAGSAYTAYRAKWEYATFGAASAYTAYRAKWE
ncbi:MAG: hypothetical protein SPI19_05310 [Peptoniphilaceae bacterium]|nr:hypothetical protein [Peptoniphilaceae bacterium]